MLRGITRETTMEEIRQDLQTLRDIKKCADRITSLEKDVALAQESSSGDAAPLQESYIVSDLRRLLKAHWDQTIQLEDEGIENLNKMAKLVNTCCQLLSNHAELKQLKQTYYDDLCTEQQSWMGFGGNKKLAGDYAMVSAWLEPDEKSGS